MEIEIEIMAKLATVKRQGFAIFFFCTYGNIIGYVHCTLLYLRLIAWHCIFSWPNTVHSQMRTLNERTNIVWIRFIHQHIALFTFSEQRFVSASPPILFREYFEFFTDNLLEIKYFYPFILLFIEMPSAAPPQAEVAGPPRTELEELQIKANQVTDEVSFRCRNYQQILDLIIKMMKLIQYFFIVMSSFSPWRVLDVCWPFAKR